MTHTQDQPKREFLRRHSTLIVYIFMTLIVAFAFTLDRLNQQADQVARCQAGTDLRNVQRATVDAVFNLAGGSLVRGPNDPKLSEEDRKRVNRYITRVNDFRDNMYAQIKPSEECEPYVKDSNVKPTTPPFAPITR